MKTLTMEEINAIQDWIYRNRDSYPSMSFADGVEAMLDVLRGNSTIDEFIEDVN